MSRIDPTGVRTATLSLPTPQITNCAFGGDAFDELYVAHLHADHVAKVRIGHVGHRLYNLR